MSSVQNETQVVGFGRILHARGCHTMPGQFDELAGSSFQRVLSNTLDHLVKKEVVPQPVARNDNRIRRRDKNRFRSLNP